MRVLRSKWIYTGKNSEDGLSDRYKARLVVAGHSQRKGTDYMQSFAPVIRMESLRLLFTVAAESNMKMKLYDVKGAYLYGNLSEDVYMEQPEGFSVGGTDRVCKLEKALYGLPQSGYYWNEKLNKIMGEENFTRHKLEPCVYCIREDGKIMIVGVYVDDFIVFGTDNMFIDEVMNRIQRHFLLRECTARMTFLGIEIEITEHGYEISQLKYIEKLVEKYRMEESKPTNNPCDCNQDLCKYEDSSIVDRKEYQELIGSLMFLTTGTRPDIAFIVGQLSQFNNDPRNIHYSSAKRVLRYLKSTKTYNLVFGWNNNLEISVATDAGWSTARDGKSFAGYSVKLGSALIGWKSKKQGLVALSTCEAELLAICDGIQEVKWLIGVLEELGIQRGGPVKLFSDSQSAIDWITTHRFSTRTKHINRKYFFVRDEVANGTVTLIHVPSKDMEADIFTKALPVGNFKKCVSELGLREADGGD